MISVSVNQLEQKSAVLFKAYKFQISKCIYLATYLAENSESYGILSPDKKSTFADTASGICMLNIKDNIDYKSTGPISFSYYYIVNAGGLFSINALAYGGDINRRRYDESVTPPEIRTEEQYNRELDEIEASLGDVPSDVNKRWYTVCVWAFEKIREADGLGIFAHPFWIEDMWNVPEALTRYMLAKKPFDAFEVLGGECYYQQNGFLTALYYDEYRRGNVLPIVGSTDSHNSTENNRKSAICSTIVFAHNNERADILQSVRDKYSVAVDTISAEYRLVGEYRLQKYAGYLMENFYPLHDRSAYTCGELMRKYYLGDADASVVEATASLVKKMFGKYFLLA